jgi:hypothetical protein
VTFYQENFTESTSVSGSESGLIRIILPDSVRDRNADPNPVDSDPYQFQANEKVEKVDFFQKISICFLKH